MRIETHLLRNDDKTMHPPKTLCTKIKGQLQIEKDGIKKSSSPSQFQTLNEHLILCLHHLISPFFHFSTIVIKDTVNHVFCSNTSGLGCFSSSCENSKDH
uniref:Uncharacterized protein n=1 Tax=Populus trichocarpa TaxID=3694 RepID=A0A2K1WWS7_POPTR